MAIKLDTSNLKGCVQLVFFVCVMARTERANSEIVLLNELDYSNDTLNRIAGDICNNLSFAEDPECLANWLSSPQILDQPADLWITKLDEYVHYEISPTEFMQAIIMVSDNEEDVVQHLLAPPFRKEKALLDASLNYTFWITTVFDNGTHSAWLQGPKLQAWNKIHENKPKIYVNYTIKIDKDYSNMLNCKCANVTFSWNVSDDSDTHFDISNGCLGNIENYNLILEPDEKEVKYSKEMPLGSQDCYFGVKSKDYGKGSLIYDLEPQAVKKITVFASPNGSGWNIRVGWVRPDHIPDRYKIVLRAAGNEYTHNASEKASETTFHGVRDGGHYEYIVSVCTFKGPVCMHESVRGVFPPTEVASSSVPVLGSLLAVILLATMLVTSVFWCRRRRHLKKTNLYPEEETEEFPKKFFPEIICDAPVVEDSWEIRPDKLQLHEVIGEGAFGVVRRGSLAPGKAVAVKMLKDYPSREEVRSFRAEMELMKSVGAHPHVVSLVGCCSGRRPLIVAEYCSRGDLLSYLRCSWDVMVSKRNAKYCNNNQETSDYRNDLFTCKSQEHSKLVINKMYDLNGICDVELTYVDLLSFCRQIAMGMEFLASNRVVHRDLAARNVLVTGDRTLKIADFGLSRDIYQENQYKQKGNGKMPVKWMALESLTHRIYTTQSDVWSFGVVVWEVVTVGGAPYPDVPAARLPRLLRQGYRMPRPNACSKQLYELMLSCWRARPRERPTFSELHGALDAMLQCACAAQYLALELDAADLRPDEPRGLYERLMDLARGALRRGSGARALNLYSSPPAPAPPPPPSCPLLCTETESEYKAPTVS